MESVYITNEPMLYSIILAVVFLFTCAVFILYTFFVERRQRKVMGKAVQSGTIVSSLFPDIIRDRMYNATNGKMGKSSQMLAVLIDSTSL
jgi:hypothetical protein